MKASWIKRWISSFLTVTMLLTMLPVTAFAQGSTIVYGDSVITETVTDVTGPDELETALQAGVEAIRITADFAIDRTFYVTADTVIYTEEAHTLTRAADFAGDIFVVGEAADGTACTESVTLVLGDPDSQISDLLVIDGNKDNLTVDVTGSVIFVCGGSKAELYENLTVTNHKKVGNERTLTGNHGVSYPEQVGGAVAVLAASSTMDVYGGTYSNNSVNVTSDATQSTYGGVVYNFGTLNVYGGVFANNASYRAGVFYNYRTLNIYSADIRNNTASLGGAIYVPASSAAFTYIGEDDGIAENSVAFAGNSATSGGAIFNSGRLSICDAAFSGNTATGSGGALYGSGKYNVVELYDCVFSNNSATNGGAIYLNGQASGVSSADVELFGKNVTFSGNSATKCGGALYLTDTARVYLAKAEFSDNSTDKTSDANGGAIYCTGSTLEVNTASFTDNGGYYGGAVSLVEASTAVMNQITADGNTAANAGGVIYAVGSELKLYNSSITNNSALSGGAVYCAASATAEIYNTEIEDNTATGNGGAVYNYTSSNLLLHTCTLSGNSAGDGKSGGALYISQAASATLYNVTATGNSANIGGVAYFTVAGTEVTINGLTVSGNTATTGGPILYGNNAGAILNINKNNYTDLDATGELDDAYWTEALKNKLTVNEIDTEVPEYIQYEQPEYDPEISSDVRSANQLEKALEAGLRSIRVLSDFKLDRTFYVTEDTVIYSEADCTLTRAADFAGDLFVVSGSLVTLELGSLYANGTLTIDGNKDNMTVDVTGSVLCVSGSAQADLYDDLSIINAQMVDSEVGGAAVFVTGSAIVNIHGGLYSGNSAASGGVVYNEATLNILGGSFVGNDAANGGAVFNDGELVVSAGEFERNSAENGGAIYAQKELSVCDAFFAENTADSFGGAICVFGTELTLTGCELTDNTAGTSGGAVSLTDGAAAEIYDVVMDGNSAESSGGAVYVINSHLSLYDSTLKNGTTYNGGGIYFHTDATGEVYNTVFEGNTVTGSGGAVNIYTGGTEVLLHSCTFTANSAAKYGGAVNLSNASKAKIYNTTATGNSADLGGVLYITTASGEPEVVVNGMTVAGNTATTAGPIIYGNTWSATLYINKSNQTDLDVAGALTDAYWAEAIVNKLTVIAITDAIPPYADFGQEDSGDMWGASDVASADELEEALELGISEIRIMDDFELDRTFYITSNTTIFTTSAHTLTRADDFAGDIFVVGEYADGTACTEEVTLTLGNPDSVTADLLVIDGNKDNMTVDVTGSVIFVCDGAKAELYENLTVRNHKKVGNERTLTGTHGVSYPELVGGAVAVLANGAAMDIYGGTYSGNGVNETSDATQSTYGGVFYNFGTMNVYGGVFENNTSYRAGVFYNYRRLNIYSAEIRNNTATLGGVIYAPSTASAITIIGKDDGVAESAVFFAGNRANNGGAISNSGKLTICDAVFEGNSAAGMGGAVYGVGSHNEILICDSEFTSNSAEKGGAISNSGKLTICDATFSDNSATSTGGAVQGAGSNDEIVICNSVFTNNSANYGGAVGASAPTLSIENSSFSGNSADAHGGALYVTSTKDAEEHLELTVTDTTFTENTSGYNGGAVYIGSGARAYMSGVTFTENTAYATANSNGSRYGGGAIYNTASVLEMDGAEFTNNVSDYNGGALAVYSSGTLILNDITASGNSAASSGGFLYNKGLLYLYNSNLTGNSSAGVGGAITLIEGATVSEIYNTVFERNTSDGNGGAVYAYTGGTEVIVHSCTFRYNSAEGSGGAFYVANRCDLKLYNNTAIANHGTNGGCMYLTTAQTSALVNGLTVSGNSADKNGPIIWVNNAESVFSINKANYTDLNRVDAPDDAYWLEALGNCETVTELSDPIPGYADYGEEDPGDLWGAEKVTSAAELEAALLAGISEIQIAADFKVERTFYITSDTIIFTTGAHTLTRADGFVGDIFVVGTAADGTVCEQTVTLTLGSPTSTAENLLVIDGESVEVSGSVLVVTGIAQADLYTNLTITNAYREDGGAAAVVQDSGVLNVYGGTYSGNSGAMYNAATLNVLGGSFVSNSATDGAAVYNDGTMTVSGGVFESNSATTGGAVCNAGTLTVTDGVFESNGADNGGAVYNTGTLTVNGGSFKSNNAVNGGAIYNADALIVAGGAVESNTATCGGGIYNNGELSVNGGSFIGNDATNGGAVYNAGELTVTDGTFESNTAESGGAIYANAAMSIAGGSFKTNTADNGGTVYNNAELTVDDGAFDGNSADNGGAAYNAGTMTVNGGSFIGNDATNGGAVYNNAELTVTNGGFEGNTADNGGAVYNANELTIAGGTFESNTADKSGGAVYLADGASAQIHDVVMDGNSAESYGGAIYVSAAHLSLYDSTLKNGTTYGGGGVYFGAGATGEVYNTVFEGNITTGHGGAVDIYTGGTEVLLHSCTFTGNSSTKNGGAVYVSNASQAKIYNTTATGNSADMGGVLYITTSSGNPEVEVNGMTVSGNTATTAGPIIYGNTWSATLYINKSNHTDLDVTGALTDAYWAEAIVNKLTVIAITDAVPPYEGAGSEKPDDGEEEWDGANASSADELEAAILAGAEAIRITADFELDRTFYITSNTTIFTTSAHTLTRAADFAGDIFVVGEYADGTACAAGVTLVLGNPDSDTADLLVIDGNKDNLTVDVTGSVIFVCGGAKVELYENLTICNHKKVGNERTLTGIHGVSYPEQVGGAVAVLANGAAMDIYGGTYSGNGVNDTSVEMPSVYGGVFYNFGTLNVYGGVFENNTSFRAGVFYNYRRLNIYSAEFRNNTATLGGVIYAPSTASAITNIGADDGVAESAVLFESNSATNGGVISNSGKLTICDAVFEGNSATATGGAVYSSGAHNEILIRDSVFTNNSANYGGAIGASETALSIESSSFPGNSANTHGGALYVVDTKELEDHLELNVTGTNFEKNTAGYNGGAVYLGIGARAYMSGVTFTENTAYATANSNGSRYGGGAIYNTASVLEMDGAEFTNNVSDYNGGALAVYSSGTLILNDITASGNSAASSGGFLYNKGLLYLYNSTLTGNSSAGVGGAISLVSATVSEIYNTVFERNTSVGNGGAVYAYTGGTEAIVHSCTFRYNSAEGNGGAFYVANLCDLKLYNNTAIANHGTNGGFLYLTTENTSVLVNGLTVSGNSADENGPIIWVNNAGAIFSINKANYTDLNRVDAPDDAYWAEALGNCETVTELSDPIPGYADYGEENPGDLWGAEEVTSAAELEAALLAGISEIQIAADFKVDRTFYITSNTTIFTTGAYTLTRAGGFDGDIFVVGTAADGTVCEQAVTLTLGSPTSTTENLLVIDGESEEVSGSVLVVTGTAQADLYANLTIANANREDGGAAAVVQDSGVLNIYGGTYTGNSGAVYNAATLNVLGGSFESNNAVDGGAVYNAGTMTVSGGVFESNSADNGGAVHNIGTMTVNGGSFKSNNAVNGGAVYNDGTLTVTDGTFESNIATCGGGVYNNAELSVTGGSFAGNSAESGGALYAGSALSITGGSFESNSATNGGAVASYGAAVTVEGGEFTSNSADNGGAIALYGSCSAQLSNLTATANKAELSGGFLYCENAQFSLTDSTLSENSSEKVGGALALGEKAVMEIRDVTFGGNTAETYGGAIHIGANVGEVSLPDCTFTNNSASYGGAVSVSRSALILSGCELTGNSADKSGGAVYLADGATAEIHDVVMDGNNATSNGGAIYVSASYLSLYDSTLKNGTTYGGGAIYFYTDATAEVYNTVFEGNVSRGHGGAVYVYTGGTEVLLHSCTFTGNSSTKNGGAVYVSNASQAKIYNTTATGNSADMGGVLYITTSSGNPEVEVNGMTVSGNTATTAGPIIYGNTWNATLYINKSNHADLDVTDALTDAYWAEAIVNKLTVIVITDAVPPYEGAGSEKPDSGEDEWTGVNATSADELEAAILAGAEAIRITADFELDRTFYITSNTTIFATSAHTLTRAADFVGDIFVVGEYADGTACTDTVTLKLGDPDSDKADLLVIDGNKDNMTVDVTGSVIFVCGGAKTELYENLTVRNHKKVGNERTLTGTHGVSYPELVGGAVAVLANGAAMDIYGGTYSGNGVNETSDATQSTYGGVFYNFGTLNVYGGVFENNTSFRAGVFYNYRRLNIYSAEFRNNTATLGGVIYAPSTASAITTIGTDDGVAESVVFFKGNSANSGGVISNSGKLTICDAVFENNSATGTGGAVYSAGAYNEILIRDSVFTNNSAHYGGAIGASGTALSIESSSFGGNSADAHGGALYVTDTKDAEDHLELNVTGTDFEKNTAGYNGGAVYLGIGARAYMSGVTFTENTAYATANSNGSRYGGGAIYNTASVLEMDGAEFTNNVSDYNGGALAVYSSGTLILNDITARGNSAAVSGGFLYNKGLLYLYNSTLTGNSSAGVGGAITLIGGATVSEIYNTVFEKNRADGNGGAVYAYTGGTEAIVHSCTFRYNSAEGSGGAFYVANLCDLKLYNNTAIANHGTNGGFLYLTTENTSVLVNGLTVSGNSADKNGPIIWVNNAGSIFSINKANYTDLNRVDAPDDAYWAETLGNCETVTELTDPIPGYADYGEEDPGDLWGSEKVTSAAELEAALLAGISEIQIAADFKVDRTFYITSDTIIFTTGAYTLTRADGFEGDIFVVGTAADGTVCEQTVTLTLGSPTSTAENLLVIDGESVEVSGSVLVVTGIAQADLYANLTIANANRVGGGAAAVVQDSGVLNVYGGTYSGNSGAMYNEAELNILGGSFVGNSAVDGGAVYNAGTLTVSGGVFESNSADNGGAVYNAGTMTINGGRFKSNNAVNGGAVYNAGELTVTGGTFESNTAKDGGGVYNNAAMSVSGGSFVGNSAENGGAVYAGSALSITGGSFESNEATNGGAVASFGAAVSVEGGEFTSNSATNGGAIYVSGGEGEVLTVTNAVFSSNNADNGGALALYDSCSASIADITATANKAELSGGFLYWENAQFSLTDSTLSANSSEAVGGALALGEKAVMEISGVTFDGNTAETYGGAVYIAANVGEITLPDCIFTDNISGYAGGAAYVSAQNTLVMTAVQASGNRSTEGGVLYVESSNVEISDSEFIGNISDFNGGVMVLAASATARLTGVTAAENTAVNSGAVISAADSTLYLLESDLTNNRSTNSGGAVSLTGGTAAEIYDVVFDGNSAGTYGGAVYIETTETETLLHSCAFTGNSAAKYGGAVYVCGGSDAKLYNMTASANSADRGGVLYITDAGTTVTVNGLTVSANTAVTEGPIIYGKTADAVLNINKTNYVDSDMAEALDDAYWSDAIANKLTVNEITDPIPGYGDFSDESAGDMENAREVSSAEELEAAINEQEKYIRIVADFEIDRTFFITYEVTIFSTAPYTLTRAADFAGDIFVIGEMADGSNAVQENGAVKLTLGNPQSATSNLLVIDGNKDNMTVPVVGTVLFINNGAQVDLYDNLSVINCHKTGNERTLNEKYVLSVKNRIGGPVSIILSGILNVYGGNYRDNLVCEEDTSSEETRNSTLGGVFYNNSNLNIYGGTFENNQAARGGIVFNYRVINVYGGSFIGNTATVSGGVFYQPTTAYSHLLIGSEGTDGNQVLFKNNTARSNGGVMYSGHYAAVVIYGNTLFEGNRTVNGIGGVAYVLGQFTARNTIFRGNSARTYGGALYFSNSTDDAETRLVDLSGCTFENNRAKMGGAVMAYASTATLKNGAIVKIHDCEFIGNQAALMDDNDSDAPGGALYAGRKATVTVTDSTFRGNSSVTQGGVLYALGEADVSFSNTTFLENTSGTHGGAIALHSVYLDLADVTFEKNHSSGSAGALYISYSSSCDVNSTVNVTGSAFTSNTSDNNGGAIYVTKQTVEKETVILTVTDTSFSYNSAKAKGGAVLLNAGSKVYMKDVSFVINSANGSKESNGGAIAVSGSSLEIDGATFTRNSSNYYGGALSLEGSSKVILHEIVASRNEAVRCGGFLYSNGAELELYDSTLDSNTARNGGAVYLSTGAVSGLYNNTFTANTAKVDANGEGGLAGAVYIYTGGTLTTMHSCTLENNHADTLGGGMYVSGCSLVQMYDLTAVGNSADKGGFLYETKSDTVVILSGLTVSGNTAVTGGPIIWGNTSNAVLNIDKANYTDLDFSGELDENYWGSAIVNLLTVNEISEEIPGYDDYVGTGDDDDEDDDDVQKEPVSVNDVFSLGLSSSDAVINSTYGKLPKLDNSSNFMSRGTTTFEEINGETVTVDTFLYPAGGKADNGQVGLGIMLYQALLYKQANPDEEVYIDVSAYRFSVQAAVNINRNSRYFGYMRNLVGKNYDEYGFVRISYLLITAAKMGIHVTVIGQLDGYPISSSNPNFYNYFTQQLNDPCDPDYVENGVIGDYLNFQFCYWTLDNKGGTDMMHTKLCAVSHYLDMNGVAHKNAVWTSSSNLDGVWASGANGNSGQQSATIISDHEEIYRASANYLRLIADRCGQEEIIEFQNLVNKRSTEQIDLILAGREDEIPADEQIVYLGSESDDVFELYFTPFGGSIVAWDEVYNPYCKYLREFYESEDYILLAWNVAGYSNSFSLGQQVEQIIIDAFHKNRNAKNKIYANLGADNAFDATTFDDLMVGEDIGFKSFDQFDFGAVHNKDLQLSYVKDGQRYFVSLLNSLNFHGGSMSYQSNFVLVIKEISCAEDSVFSTIARLSTKGDIAAHEYGEKQIYLPDDADGYAYHACKHCGKTEYIGVVHHEGDWIVDREATAAQNGLRHKECSICGTLTAAEVITSGTAASVDIGNLTGKTFGASKYGAIGKLNGTPYTFEATISLPKSVNGRGGVIMGNYGNSENPISFEIYYNGQVKLFAAKGSERIDCLFDTDVRSDERTHIAVTVNGTTAKLYVNGVLAETKTLSAELPETTGAFRLGGDYRTGNDQYFKGTIYSAALFGDVRTEQEIKRDVLLVTGDSNALLYSDYLSETGDSVSAETTVLTGQTFSEAVVGELGKLTATPHTFEAIVNLAKSVNGRGGVIVGSYGSCANPISLEIYYNGRVRLYYVNNGSVEDCVFSTDIRSDAPVHIAVTVSGLTATLYVDGVLTEAKTLSVAMPEAEGSFRVGGDHRRGNTAYFQGRIYSIALFGDERTAQEVKRDTALVTGDADALLYLNHFTGENSQMAYAMETMGGRTFQADERYQLKTLEGTPATFEATIHVPVSMTDRAGVIVGNYDDGTGAKISLEIYTQGRVRLYAFANGTVTDCIFSTDIRSDGPVHLAVTVDGTTATLYVNGIKKETKTLNAALPAVTNGFCIGGDNRGGNARYFKGTIYSVNLFEDVRTADEIKRDAVLVAENEQALLYSGYFTESGNAVAADGQVFDAVSGCVLGRLDSAPYTFEAIISVPKTISGRAGVISGNYDGGAGSQINLEIYTQGRIRLYAVSGGKIVDCIFSTDIRSDGPTHIAVTVDGKTAVLYVNGIKKETKTLSAALPAVTEGWRIGGDHRAGNEQYFKGTLYAVHMFSDVRTAAEVARDAVMVTSDAQSLLYSGYFTNRSRQLVFDTQTLGGQRFNTNVVCEVGRLTAVPYTMEAVILVPESMDERAGVVVGNYNAGSGAQINLEIYTQGRVRLYVMNGGKIHDCIFSTDIRSDWLTHIAVTVSGTKATLYVNGEAVETKTLSMALPAATTGWCIGGDNRGGNGAYFRGTIYSVSLFGDVRTAAEIRKDAIAVDANADRLLFSGYFTGENTTDIVHSEGEWIVDYEVSALGNGIKHTECVTCGKIMRVSEIPVDISVDYGELGLTFSTASALKELPEAVTSGPRTIEVMLQLSPEYSERGGILVGNFDDNSEEDLLSLEIYTNGKPRLYYQVGGQTYNYIFKTDVRSEVMTHLAITIDGTKAMLYLNGEWKETVTLTAEVPSVTTGYCIGGDHRSGNTQYFKGVIYAVTLFDDVRTAEEIALDAILVTGREDGLLYTEYIPGK